MDLDKQINLRLSGEQKHLLEQIAKRWDVSQSEVLRRLLEEQAAKMGLEPK